MLSVARKIFGSVNDRKLKPLRARVNRINALEPMMEALSDEALSADIERYATMLGEAAAQIVEFLDRREPYVAVELELIRQPGGGGPLGADADE